MTQDMNQNFSGRVSARAKAVGDEFRGARPFFTKSGRRCRRGPGWRRRIAGSRASHVEDLPKGTPGSPQLRALGVDWGYPRFTGGRREPMMLT